MQIVNRETKEVIDPKEKAIIKYMYLIIQLVLKKCVKKYNIIERDVVT